jgi:hypothetical protein
LGRSGFDEALEHRLPVQARQEQIEHDELVDAGAGQLETPAPVRRAVHAEPFGREGSGHETEDHRFVVDHEDARHTSDAIGERATKLPFVTGPSSDEAGIVSEA